LVVPVFDVLPLVVEPVLVVGRVFAILPVLPPVVVFPPVIVFPPVVVFPPVIVLPPVDDVLPPVVVLLEFEFVLRNALAFELLPVSDEQLPPTKASVKIADNVNVFFTENSPVLLV
jgi:hypothetical protein